MTSEQELVLLRYEMRDLRQRVARAERSNEQLRSRVVTLEKENQLLRAENTVLKKENTELKQKLEDTTNHKNTLAGMIFKPKFTHPPSDRSVGGQEGHAPHNRDMPSIDERKRVFISHCPHCGKKLARTTSNYTRTVTDIPPQVKAITTEYTIERQHCYQCKEKVCAVPINTLPETPFGVHLITKVLMLRFEARLPINRIAAVLVSDYALSLSEGTIATMIQRTELLQKRYTAIATRVARAPQKHADESSWNIAGESGWIWSFSTQKYSFYTIEETRGKGVPERILADSPPKSLLICDD